MDMDRRFTSHVTLSIGWTAICRTTLVATEVVFDQLAKLISRYVNSAQRIVGEVVAHISERVDQGVGRDEDVRLLLTSVENGYHEIGHLGGILF
jgi:hypothetical protein